MSKKLRFALIGLGIVGAMLYLVYSGIQAKGVPYETIASLHKVGGDKPRTVKVTGKVVKGSIKYQPEKPLLRLSVSGPDTDQSIRVIYEGIKPDALRAGGHVIVNGRYDPQKSSLTASTLLAKCPSRYKSKYDSYSKTKQSDKQTAASSDT
ncbi:MAG: cytochrome c maturation protein CcmE [bacterium]